MSKKKLTVQGGFTLMELMVATSIMVIVVCAIGVVTVDSQRGWNTMYDCAWGDVATDGYVARAKFDAVMRKASMGRLLMDDSGNWLEAYYYADADSAVIDRYARFYLSGSELKFEYGSLGPRAQLSTQTICSNVSSCVFKAAGRSVQMILTLDDGVRTAAVVSSAAMHNR